MAKEVSFVSLLQMIQEYISQNYAAALSDKKKLGQLRSYICLLYTSKRHHELQC